MKTGKFSLRSLAQWSFLAAGLAFLVLNFTYRIPGLYDGLWEDEIHYNEPLLSFSRLSAVRQSAESEMKPMLDYTIRKLLFGKSFGIPRNERNLHLISLLFSIVQLAILLFVPWTEFKIPRIAAALLVAFSSVEIQYSTEAQLYSITSLMGSAFFMGLMKAFQLVNEGRINKAAMFAGFMVLLSANTHFFNAGLIAAGILVFAIALLKSAESVGKRVKIISAFGGLLVAITAATYAINEPAITWMLSQKKSIPSSSAFSLSGGLPSLSWNYEFLGIPAFAFYLLAAIAMIHPTRSRRWTAWALGLAVIVFKTVGFAYYNSRSDQALAVRYTIMYLGPAALLIGLGLDGFLLFSKRAFQKATPNYHWIPQLALILGLIFIRPPHLELNPLISTFSPNVKLLMETPGNYSPNFYFFDKVRQLDAPVLILTNHCWASDVPMFYLNRTFGRPYKELNYQVIETAGCQHSSEWLAEKSKQFMDENGQTGYVVYFFERGVESSGCLRNWIADYKESSQNGCRAIYKARNIRWPLI